MQKVRIIKKKGHPEIKFHVGGLHQTTSTPSGEKIPASKIQAALSGKYGAKGEKQAMFMKNVLHK